MYSISIKDVTSMVMMEKKSTIKILAIVFLLLLIPFVAMHFTTEINWSVYDFLLMGCLLFGVGLLINFVVKRSQSKNYRILMISAILIGALLIWIELAVGIFGSPFAGS